MYQNNQRNNVITVLFLLAIFLNTQVVGQAQCSEGYVFGSVAIDDPSKEYSIRLPSVLIELRRKDKIIVILSNDAGLIDEKLAKGQYFLTAVKTRSGELFEFVADQRRNFEIRANKAARFHILVKPRN